MANSTELQLQEKPAPALTPRDTPRLQLVDGVPAQQLARQRAIRARLRVPVQVEVFGFGLAVAYMLGTASRGDAAFVVGLAIEVLVLRLVASMQSVDVKTKLLLSSAAIGIGFGLAYLIYGLPPQDVAMLTLFLVSGQKLSVF